MPTCPILMGYFRSMAADSTSVYLELKTSMLFRTKQSMSESQSLSSGMARRTISRSCLGTSLPSCASFSGSMDLASRVAAAGAAISGDLSATSVDVRGRSADGGGSIPFSLAEEDVRDRSADGGGSIPFSLAEEDTRGRGADGGGSIPVSLMEADRSLTCVAASLSPS